MSQYISDRSKLNALKKKQLYTEHELVNIICSKATKKSYKQKGYFSSGNLKNNFIDELSRFCTYSVLKKKYTIIECFDKPIEKTKNYKEYPSLNVKRKHYDKIGVYSITEGNNIYIGSTCSGFKKRFWGHYHKSNQIKHTSEMVHGNGTFQILWIAPKTSTVEDVRNKEKFYLEKYKNDSNWNVVNSKDVWDDFSKYNIYNKRADEESFNEKEKTSYKYIKLINTSKAKLLARNEFEIINCQFNQDTNSLVYYFELNDSIKEFIKSNDIKIKRSEYAECIEYTNPKGDQTK